MPQRVLLVFVDGVGLGENDPATNPFVVADLPALRTLLGNPVTARAAPQHSALASLVGVDAVLGHEGTPQSGTGQASLLTGANAVALNGRHFGPWVPSRLRALVRNESVLARAQQAGYSTGFANAYPEEITTPGDVDVRVPSDMSGKTPGGTPGGTPDEMRAGIPDDRPRGDRRSRDRRGPSFLRAGPPLAALGAGLLTRHTPDLERGTAVASEITNEGWRERLGRTGVPEIDGATAGRNLARIAAHHALTFFAHYATDYAGHLKDMSAAVGALEKLDAFIGGMIDEADDDLLIAVVSDHGNIEDIRAGHTRNPALGLVIGKGHEQFARRLVALTDVTPAVLDALARQAPR